ncbi:hypothetical protein L3X38_000255 (mitochondrion) [Prunus dulcis]|uniref:Uncharacterized protein n=1 Tax=Prunus dulcis TaxID=3755 RepID=A0AAD4YJY1_PRUDU|nr:hypothetical protein L3X38_000255 [Prunus dulcis]
MSVPRRKTAILRISKLNSVLAVEGRNPIPSSSHPRIVSSRGLTGKGVSKRVRNANLVSSEETNKKADRRTPGMECWSRLRGTPPTRSLVSKAVENGKKTSAKKRSLPARRKISGHRLLLTLVWRSQLASWFLKSVYSFALDRSHEKSSRPPIPQYWLIRRVPIPDSYTSYASSEAVTASDESAATVESSPGSSSSPNAFNRLYRLSFRRIVTGVSLNWT